MSANRHPETPVRQQNAGVALRTDTVGLIARRALDAAAIAHILLKGRAFARLLYDADWERAYHDTDILVPPGDVERAGAALTEAGFIRPDSGLLDLPPHYAQFWIHRKTGTPVDLHWSLPGAHADPERVWRELSARTVTLEVGGYRAFVLNPPASAFLCAVHVARHGPRFPAPTQDLERALQRLDYRTWEEAAELARAAVAERAFGAGLGLLPSGRAMATRLDVAVPTQLDTLIKAQDDPRYWPALLFESVLGAGGLRPALREVWLWAFPPTGAVRARYRWAARHRLALVVAYGVRLLRAPLVLVRGALMWLEARRVLRKSRETDSRRV